MLKVYCNFASRWGLPLNYAKFLRAYTCQMTSDYGDESVLCSLVPQVAPAGVPLGGIIDLVPKVYPCSKPFLKQSKLLGRDSTSSHATNGGKFPAAL